MSSNKGLHRRTLDVELCRSRCSAPQRRQGAAGLKMKRFDMPRQLTPAIRDRQRAFAPLHGRAPRPYPAMR
jgi:hypothetical protein